MLGVSPRRSAIRIAKLKASSPGWSVKGKEIQSWWRTMKSPRMETSTK
ncbi:hypothetical protein E2C01_037459 [Portunus trituberculatus]|uniref:Uncharacterized protein n=1 Tax=Portunus trituberculatus TaxID=210409 RepID=A0A5B7FEN6_PORTR|nr:hypothetical protein [Portunus trituberculatus]